LPRRIDAEPEEDKLRKKMYDIKISRKKSRKK
jgi:hypothetical protein